MGRNLGPLNIKDSYEGLVQISGSDQLTDGSGSLISSLDIAVSTATSASHAVIADSALTATSASHAVNADSAISSSYALTASFAENASVGTLQEVTDAGNTTTNEVNVAELYVDNANPTDKRLHVYVTGNGIHYNLSGSTADDHMFEINQTDIIRFQTSSITAYKDIDATGLTITANQVDATTFNGDLNGTASVSTAATIFGDNTNAERPLVFVDDNPSTGVGQVEQLRGDTTKSITYNPVTNVLTVPNTTTTASYATLALTASYAENAAGADPFPYTGSADISGSIDLHGHITTGFADNVISSALASHAIIGGQDSEVSAGSNGNVIVNGFSAVISSTGGVNTIVGANSTISGNLYNGIYSNQAGSITGGSKNVRIGGTYGTISGGGNSNAAVGGDSNNITGNISHAAILGGNGNTVTHNRSVVIGGNALSTSKDDEVVVPSLVATELTASGLIYPTSDGSNGDVLTTDGAGNLTLQPAAGGAAFPYTGSAEITGSLGVTGSLSQGDTNSNLGTNTAILSSGHSLISASVLDSAIISSTGSYQSSTQPGRTAIIASDDSYIDATRTDTRNMAIIASEDSRITGTGQNRQSALIATRACINQGSRFSAIIGGEINTLDGCFDSGLVAGGDNKITGGGTSVIAGGFSNDILGSSNRAFIAGGQGNQLNNGDNSAIIGGASNAITNHDRSVILGGNALATSKSDEVVVPSLTTNGAVVQNVQALTITSNTASLDASTGQMFTLGLQNATDTHLEISNQVAGQTFSLKLTNNATAAGTITFDTQFEFEGGSAFTATAATNAVDILTFTTFDGTSVQCVGSKNFS